MVLRVKSSVFEARIM